MSLLIPTPSRITYKEEKNNKTIVTIEPCYPGYGITIGNALRRVLLSSLPGGAVSAVKIQGIEHEYDTIDFVKEDIVEILMNLKRLRVSLHSDEPVVLELVAKGEKVVTAADIKKNAQVDIANKDLVIATLTDKKAELSLEITVTHGIGYESVEERVVEKKEIGLIQIDSRFSPIANVGFKIEHVRIGQRTDYEKIVLDLFTDGSIEPKDAINACIKILQEQLDAIAVAHEAPQESKKKDKEDESEEEIEDKKEDAEKKNDKVDKEGK